MLSYNIPDFLMAPTSMYAIRPREVQLRASCIEEKGEENQREDSVVAGSQVIFGANYAVYVFGKSAISLAAIAR